jgi:hypothetical protein
MKKKNENFNKLLQLLPVRHMDNRMTGISGYIGKSQEQAHSVCVQTLFQQVVQRHVNIASLTNTVNRAVPWLRRLVAGLPLRRPRFDPESVHVEFVVDKVALGQVFLRVVSFPLSISFH